MTIVLLGFMVRVRGQA